MNLNEFLNTDIKIPSSVDTDLQLVSVILIYKIGVTKAIVEEERGTFCI